MSIVEDTYNTEKLLELKKLELAVATKRSQNLKWIAAILGGIIIIVAFSFIITAYVGKNTQFADLQRTAQKNNDNTLAALKAQQASDRLQREKDDCLAAYARQVSAANQLSISAALDMVSVIANNTPSEDPNSPRVIKAAQVTQEIQSAQDAYAKAILDRQAYIDSDYILPCPIASHATSSSPSTTG